VKVGELTRSELAQRLGKRGLYLRTGPFVYCVRSRLPRVAQGVAELYGDFPLPEDERFADFHLRIARPRGLRRYIAPLASVAISGAGRFDPFPRSTVYPYFEWGLNWCVYNLATQYLVLHAATLERNGRAIMLIGPSGSGKSTLCASLALSGWRLLSDEFALFSLEDGLLSGLARPISLKNQSIELIARRFPDSRLGSPSGTLLKGTVAHVRPSPESVERVDQRAVPGWFVFVKYEPDSPAHLTPSRKGMAMMRIASYAFNYGILGRQGFETLGSAIQQCECYHLRYSELDEVIPLLDEMTAGNRQPAAQSEVSTS